jgi:hypothetical protein
MARAGDRVAKRGEAWRPSNAEDDMNALIAAEKALAQ